MSKYDKSVSISHEEEGTYHRREIEHIPANNKNTTKSYIKTQVVPVKPSSNKSLLNRDTSDDEDNFEEWTTSKRKVNHKTRQVETRVSRQLLVEDGKVIADSGPQVTTRIKEDNRVEECEKEKAPKNKNKFDAIKNAPECDIANGRILGEKKEIQRVKREVREENMQYHDERFKELTGHDVHKKAIKSPNELITINNNNNQQANSQPRGKMVHYSNKGKIFKDTDEILEVAKLAIDGSITKEIKHTHHHEEESEDELPDEKGEAEKLRSKPVELKSKRRTFDYVNDFDDTRTPPESSGDEIEGDVNAIRRHNRSRNRDKYHHPTTTTTTSRNHDDSDEAFPRYKIDPLLNSLKDDDYKPVTSNRTSSSGGRQLPLYKKDRSDSPSTSDDDHDHHHQQQIRRYHQQQHLERQRSISPKSGGGPVEIPEEYRVNKQRLMNKSKSPSSSLIGNTTKHHQQRDRSFSPTNKSHLSHKSTKSHRSSHRGEDASVQAHLTDEEIEKRSMKSSSSHNSHEKQTRHLQRQSTANSSRNYYFGESRKRHQKQQQTSLHGSSTSLSSLSDPKERLRKNGARSRDSGFRSPNEHHRQQQQQEQQIYSVSNKQKKNYDGRKTISPSPTTGSLGQRSVKTTTTTISANLEDNNNNGRANSRNDNQTTFTKQRSSSSLMDKKGRGSSNGNKGNREKFLNNNHSEDVSTNDEDNDLNSYLQNQDEGRFHRNSRNRRGKFNVIKNNHNYPQQQQDFEKRVANDSFDDNVSICSLGPNATTIKVPYKPAINIESKVILPKQHLPIVSNNIINQREMSQQQQQDDDAKLINNRADNIKRIPLEVESIVGNDRNKFSNEKQSEQEYFDYKTVIATVHNSQPQPPTASTINKQNNQSNRQNIIETYNVRVIQHNSPFLNNKQEPIKSINDLSTSIARLELLSSELGLKKKSFQQLEELKNNSANNNELDFNLDDYDKHKAYPAYVADDSGIANSSSYLEDDRVSLVSSCSLRSSRTYHISGPGGYINNDNNDDLDYFYDNNEEQEFNNNQLNNNDISRSRDSIATAIEDNNLLVNNNNFLDLENDDKKPAAWIFDPRDGSSTAIIAPARPLKPESPKIDSKTEDLAESKGGRSYYLELIEKEKPTIENERQEFRKRPNSIDSLYSRRNSINAINNNNNNNKFNQPPQRQSTPTKTPNLKKNTSINNKKEKDPTRNSRQMVPATLIDSTNNVNNNNDHKRPIYASSTIVNNNHKNTGKNNIKSISNKDINNSSQQIRRQLPFSGPPSLTNRSKSSSCLLTSTKPSKYSLYGGLKRANGENKPVPRLSYSRAIGPKSQRQIDAQPKTPSRYLKMK